MKLELKHLAGYLPYELKIECKDNSELGESSYISEMTGLHESGVDDNYGNNWTFGIKPILRPLSDLTKEIEVNGEKFVPHTKLGGRPNLKDYDIVYLSKNIDNMSFGLIQKLLEWHFDIYGLIENGLAININTLP